MRAFSNRSPVRCLAACVASIAIAACGQSPSSGDSAPAAAAPVAASVVKTNTAVEPDSPCRLLTDAEVRAVFPGAKAGQPERSREEYGIKACQWPVESGRFLAEVWKAKNGTAENEIHGLAAGFVDPTNAAAANDVRYQPIAGVGEQAFAVVETRDAQRGILDDIAMLVARKNGRILVLLSDELAHRDRATAMQALTALGRESANRL